MSKINDGGPIYPHIMNHCQVKNESEMYEGLTLRDYFAAHAPDPPYGWIGDGKDRNERLVKMLERTDNDIFALFEWRWFYADMMIASRDGFNDEQA